MRVDPRRAAAGLIIAAVAAALLLPAAIYLFGLLVAPPRPVAETGDVPTLIGDALWARADGGPARHLRPIDPLSIAQLALCLATAPGENDNERIEECRHVLPALRGLEYLSNLHIKDHGIARNSFIGGHGAAATTVWMTRSWTRTDFVNTLAARGDFGFGWRGLTLAARRYFDREPSAVTLPQAALLASRLGDGRPDPWCEPEAAALMRNRVLARMLDNGAIGEAEYQAASTAPLELASPPEGRPDCGN